MRDAKRRRPVLAGAGVVQPVLSEISDIGETSFVFIDGAFTHAIRKTPKAGDLRCQEEFGGVSERIDPPGLGDRRGGARPPDAARGADLRPGRRPRP